MEHKARSPESISPFESPESDPFIASEDDEDRQAQLNKSIEQRYQHWPRSSYSDVTVLLLRWAADNLGVIDEVRRLEDILSKRFNFSTELWDIPSDEPEDELTRRILTFCKNKRKGSLLVLYYAGHGDGRPEECIWAATSADDSPWLNWHKIQGHLLAHDPDVLLILDCCCASSAAGVHSIGRNWFLGSSVKESAALGVSWRSFTSAMIRQLERAANRYWENGKKYDIQSLSHDLNFRETDLLVTPNCLRLNSDHCEPTDLTPLLYPRQRNKLTTAQTAPAATPDPQKPRGSVPSKQPRREQSTHSPLGALQSHHEGPSQDKAPMIAFDLAAKDHQTLRFQGLPLDADAKDVTDWLRARLGDRAVRTRVGPIIPIASSQTTTVTFLRLPEAERALAIKHTKFQSRTSSDYKSIKIDHQFQGLTTIYDSSSARDSEPIVDIVLLHDAYGHPINSFACHYLVQGRKDVSIERCWPRDKLARNLEVEGVPSRIMTYGWPAASWLDSNETYCGAVNEFIKHLTELRTSPQRPLVFIGHGLGGVLAKHATSNIINFGLGEDDFQNPVKLCVFFGTPHCGLNDPTNYASIVAKMKRVSISDRSPLTSSGFRRWNGPLSGISREFQGLQSEYGIDVLSISEQMVSETEAVVPKSCALYDHATRRNFEIGSSHRNLAKLRSGENAVQDVLNGISSSIQRKLDQKRNTVPESEVKNRENIYERLREYDTFFLIDDSTSMETRWTTTARVLADIVSIAVKYDENGVDVKFFNKPIKEKERTELDTTEKVMRLFDMNTPPTGGTLTADVLGKVLNEYMASYRENRKIKGLNLIVLTDGEPDPEQDVEGVLTKYAKKLQEADADDYQVGVQFVQIGGDEKARRFLEFLDDELKAKHKLDRDASTPSLAFSDVVLCLPLALCVRSPS